eukprot:Rhum_TRINITY_DN12917_c0_g1::Rhum_TRINITY_DN12917_c0_g1_i1::g.55401::m.55401
MSGKRRASSSSAYLHDDGDMCDAEETPNQLHIVLVCGVMGSGKSTFCGEWVRRKPGWQRVSQDDVVSLSAQIAAVDVVLRIRGESVVADRVCSDLGQRRAFRKLARRTGACLHCVFLRPPVDTCVAQLRGRGDAHPRFPYSPENARTLRATHSAFDPPCLAEGFSSLLRLTSTPRYAAAVEASFHSGAWLRASEENGEEGRSKRRCVEALCEPTRLLSVAAPPVDVTMENGDVDSDGDAPGLKHLWRTPSHA